MTIPAIRRTFLVASAAIALTLSQAGLAADTSKDEIDHLLNFVASSSCTFIRNGTEYPSDKARDHLASKYQFAGSRITTADEFIRYLATESSMSGEPYHVRCGKTEALSGVWLTTELTRYRKETAKVQAAR
jgi:hypothetical protein